MADDIQTLTPSQGDDAKREAVKARVSAELAKLDAQAVAAREAAREQSKDTFLYRKYLVVPVADLSKVDVAETPAKSLDHARRSLDGTQAIVKWDDGDLITPDFLSHFPGAQVLSHDEALALMVTEEWTDPKATPIGGK